jgi:hypothetical protein
VGTIYITDQTPEDDYEDDTWFDWEEEWSPSWPSILAILGCWVIVCGGLAYVVIQLFRALW